MGFLYTLKSLFAASKETPEPPVSESYKGFEIRLTPIKEGNQFRVGATISKGDCSHRMIRADVMFSQQECEDLSRRKAQGLIDQQGDNMFATQG